MFRKGQVVVLTTWCGASVVAEFARVASVRGGKVTLAGDPTPIEYASSTGVEVNPTLRGVSRRLCVIHEPHEAMVRTEMVPE